MDNRYTVRLLPVLLDYLRRAEDGEPAVLRVGEDEVQLEGPIAGYFGDVIEELDKGQPVLFGPIHEVSLPEAMAMLELSESEIRSRYVIDTEPEREVIAVDQINAYLLRSVANDEERG